MTYINWYHIGQEVLNLCIPKIPFLFALSCMPGWTAWVNTSGYFLPPNIDLSAAIKLFQWSVSYLETSRLKALLLVFALPPPARPGSLNNVDLICRKEILPSCLIDCESKSDCIKFISLDIFFLCSSHIPLVSHAHNVCLSLSLVLCVEKVATIQLLGSYLHSHKVTWQW